MGWFSKDKPAAPDAANRQDRQRCWESRDAYFACLDTAKVVKAGDEGSACAATKAAYEDNCAKSWVRQTAVLCLLSLIVLRLTISTNGASSPSSSRGF